MPYRRWGQVVGRHALTRLLFNPRSLILPHLRAGVRAFALDVLPDHASTRRRGGCALDP